MVEYLHGVQSEAEENLDFVVNRTNGRTSL